LTTFLPGIDKEPSRILLHTPTFAGYLLPKLEVEILTLVLLAIIVIGSISNLVVEWKQSLAPFDPGQKILAATFNDITTRTAGLNSIDFSTNYDVTNLMAIYWMYIAGYPVAVRVTQTLHPVWFSQMVGFYLKKFLLSGKWWVLISMLIITLAERHKLKNDPVNFTFFRILFEVISGYGTVGLSLGFPGVNASFCATWTTLSKVILMFLMFIGRHRRLTGTLLNTVQQGSRLGKDNPNTNINTDNEDMFYV